MVGEGFEPSKALPSDLQSDPFDRSGNPPVIVLFKFKPIRLLESLIDRNPLFTRATEGNRTLNLLITNQLLCQLSYSGLPVYQPRSPNGNCPTGKTCKYTENNHFCNMRLHRVSSFNNGIEPKYTCPSDL